MRKPDPNIIRIGDKVKIITPEFFVRCGYDNDHKSACEYVTSNYCDQIVKFILESEYAPTPSLGIYKLNDIADSFLFKKIVSALAYERVGQLRASGMERKIYNQQEKWLKGKTFFVNDIFFCKTGVYCHPSGGYNYWGEYDYNPGGLSAEKTHKILVLTNIPIISVYDSPVNAIKAINVEKVK